MSTQVLQRPMTLQTARTIIAQIDQANSRVLQLESILNDMLPFMDALTDQAPTEAMRNTAQGNLDMMTAALSHYL